MGLQDKRQRTIWSIMLTGASKERLSFARWSVKQWRQLSPVPRYAMRLLILNEAQREQVLEDGEGGDSIVEIRVDRRLPHLSSLGAVRNHALSLIPSGDLVYVWDDDDYHAPEIILTMLAHWKKTSPSACMIQLGNRLNLNMVTQAGWASTDTRGLVHFLGSIDRLRQLGFQYDLLNSLEDLPIHTLPNRLLWADNPPELYVRYTHQSNASVYVKKSQKGPELSVGPYVEKAISPAQLLYCIGRLFDTHVNQRQ